MILAARGGCAVASGGRGSDEGRTATNSSFLIALKKIALEKAGRRSIYKKFFVLKEIVFRKLRRDFLVSENIIGTAYSSGIRLCKTEPPRSRGIRSCKSELLVLEGFARSSRNVLLAQPARTVGKERGDGRERDVCGLLRVP